MSKTHNYDPERQSELGEKGGAATAGIEYEQRECPGCGKEFGQLPAHMRACDDVGGSDWPSGEQ